MWVQVLRVVGRSWCPTIRGNIKITERKIRACDTTIKVTFYLGDSLFDLTLKPEPLVEPLRQKPKALSFNLVTLEPLGIEA
jgi:hypothetical protein